MLKILPGKYLLALKDTAGKLKVLPLLFFALLLTLHASGQQDAYYSQYKLNLFLINPAVAGYDGYRTISLISREQWIGIPGAPSTNAFSAQTRIMRNSYIRKGAHVKKNQKPGTTKGRVGVGAFVYNDHVGLINRTGFQITYAYHIPLDKAQLSFGLSLNAYQFRINSQDIVVSDPSIDALKDAASRGIFIPDANFGTYYTTENYYVGFSASDLAQSSLKISSGTTVDYKILRNYYLVGGYHIPLDGNQYIRRPTGKDGLVLEPNMLLKVSETGAVQLDAGARLLFGDLYWAGLSYRTPNILIIMGGVRLDKFYVGYAFDANFSPIMNHTFGSHEISVVYKFGDNARRFRWINQY